MGLCRSLTKLIALLICTVALSSPQPEILSVSETGETVMISRTGTDDWLHDYFCFFENEKRLGCGEVTEVFPNRLEITLFERGKTLVTQKLGNGNTALLRMRYLEPRIKSHHQARLMYRGQKKTDEETATPSERAVAGSEKPLDKTPATPIAGDESEEAPFPGEPEPVKRAEPKSVAEATPPKETSENEEEHEKEPERDAASTPTGEALWSKTKVTDPMGSLGLGVNFIFPRAHYEQVIATHWTLGVSAHLVNYLVESGPRLTGPAYGVSLNFYEGGKLTGLWIRLAGEFIELKTTGSSLSRAAAPAVTGNVGWRWYFNSGFNFGIAGGLNYIFLPKARQQEWKFNGAIPSILLDVSFAF